MAINDHILLLMGYDLGASYSTDDGATWTDISATFQDLDTAEYYIGGTNGHRAACTDGNTWLVMSGAGFWTSSTDSVTWTESTTAWVPLSGGGAGFSVLAEDCIYMPARANPVPGTRRWNRWIMCGATSTTYATDPSGELPALAWCSLTTADPPLSGSSTWSKVVVSSSAQFEDRNIRWKSMALDPINYRLWIVGIDYAFGRLVMAYADRTDLETWSGLTHLTLRDATAELPAYLREGGHQFETVYSTIYTIPQHYMVLDYDARSQCLRLLVQTDGFQNVDAYMMPCGTAYNTYAWTTTARNVVYDQSFPGFYSPTAVDAYPYYVYGHPGNIHSMPMYGSGVFVDGVFSRFLSDKEGLDGVDEPVLSLQTNGGSGLTVFAGDNGSYTFAVIRSAGSRISENPTWITSGVSQDGYPSVLIQAPSAAASLAAGVTMTAPAFTHWYAPAPVFCGVVHPNEIPTATTTAWAAPVPTLAFGFSLTSTLSLAAVHDASFSGAVLLADSIALTGASLSELIDSIREVLAITGTHLTQLTTPNYIAEALLLIDSVTLVWVETPIDTVALADTVLEVPVRVTTLIDAISLSGAVSNWQEALDLVVDAIALSTLLEIAPIELVNDTVAFAAVAAQWAEAVNTIVEALVLTGTALPGMTLTVVVADTVDFVDSPLTALTMVDTVADTIGLYASFRIGDEIFRGYVLNAANKAASEYENFQFNSMAQLGQRVFLAGAAGLFEFTGDDDAGADIEATVRTGLLSIADGKMSRIDSAYVGYASDGTMVLKATITSFSGEKQEHWYQLKEQNAPVPREGRIKLGLGLKSVYWQFELVNASGSTLDLDSIRLHRVVLDRRI